MWGSLVRGRALRLLFLQSRHLRAQPLKLQRHAIELLLLGEQRPVQFAHLALQMRDEHFQLHHPIRERFR